MIHVRSLCTVLLAATLTTAAAVAQEGKGQPVMPPGQEEIMKKWQAFMTPGEGHKVLQAFSGNWNVVAKMWMDPAQPPTESTGTESSGWILGGRYLQSSFKTTMMGMPMEGVGTMGYDNNRKKYFLTWIDNFGTGLATAEGTLDRTGTVLSLYGKMDEPTTGERDKPVKYVYRIDGPDKHVFEIHDLTIGEPHTKVMEAVYTRKK